VSWRGSQKSELDGSAGRPVGGGWGMKWVGAGEGVPDGDKEGQDTLADKSSESWLAVVDGGWIKTAQPLKN
jgi:hypothetical protein